MLRFRSILALGFVSSWVILTSVAGFSAAADRLTVGIAVSPGAIAYDALSEELAPALGLKPAEQVVTRRRQKRAG